MEYYTRTINLKDIDNLLLLIIEFSKETNWNYNYSESNTLREIGNVLLSDNGDILGVFINNTLVGFSIISYGHEFSEERIGYLSKFYINTNHRKTLAGRTLLKAVTDWFDDMDCINSFGMDTAYIQSQGFLFRNLLGKGKYKPCATTLVRNKYG